MKPPVDAPGKSSGALVTQTGTSVDAIFKEVVVPASVTKRVGSVTSTPVERSIEPEKLS